MKILITIAKLLVVWYVVRSTKGAKTSRATADGRIIRRHGSVTPSNDKNETPVCELNVFDTMPKRVRSKSLQKSKKLRQNIGLSANKRLSIPRNCKSSNAKTFSDINFLSVSSNRPGMGATFMKFSEKERESKKEKEEVTNWSSDELDVVFDVQEEKKNKIYEVITVMSDDETPNKVTYERLYADDTESKVVEKPNAADDSSEIDVLNDNDIVTEVIKEASLITENAAAKVPAIIKNRKKENNVDVEIKDDSDSEVVCVAVLDAKTKAEQKNIEEICLSSDSDIESVPTVPPLRIKIPISDYRSSWDFSRFLGNNSNDSLFGSNTKSSFSFGRKRASLKSYKSKESFSDWDSLSSSAKATSSDELSPVYPESPKVLSGDDSSSSAVSDLSQPQHTLSPSSDNENSSSSSSSVDEEKDIYWKADREARRKSELRHEEYTDFGRKIRDGEVEVNDSLKFKVMSYNVLAQNLLEQHMYLYNNHDRRALGWARRWALIYSEIKNENPEILCLQEVEQAHLATHFAKLLDLGYRWVFKKRTSQYQDGVAVLYKSAVFEAEDQSLVELHQPGVSVLDRDNVAAVVRLRFKQYPTCAVVVATTHLLYNPRRSDVRLAQVQVLLAEIDRLAYNKDALTYYPVILTGDFNLKPSNGVYTLVTEGRLEYEGKSRRTLREPEDQNILPRTLLPRRLGITDRCQHDDVLEARVRGEEATRTRLYHSEHNRDSPQETNRDESCSKDDRFESGTLCHGFNFQSVYTHRHQNGQKEASTHHEEWVTVDYIFYSRPKGKEESSLQLLSRMRLPSQEECDRFLRFLPNFAFGSDHIPLVGKFLLRMQ